MKERIEELTKYFEEIKEEEIKIEAEIEEEKEMESKKLDGAPIEASSKFSKTNKKNTYKIPNSHNTVLSKMYR
jgi:DNA-binding protein H-NS